MRRKKKQKTKANILFPCGDGGDVEDIGKEVYARDCGAARIVTGAEAVEVVLLTPGDELW